MIPHRYVSERLKVVTGEKRHKPDRPGLPNAAATSGAKVAPLTGRITVLGL